MNRRGIFGLFAGLAAFCAAPLSAVAKSAPRAPRYRYIDCGYRGPSVKSFAELQEWLDKLPVRQFDGSPSAVCEQTGEPYVAFHLGGYARPSDEAFIEAGVAARMQNAITDAIERVQPKRIEDTVIYWRQRFESEVSGYERPIEFREDGPDIDWITGQRCVLDRNWVKVGGYCRLTITTIQKVAWKPYRLEVA